MRRRLGILGYYAIFWIGFQILIRAIFLLYNHDLSGELTRGELFKVFWCGLKMDLSMSGYLLMFTSMMLTISVLTQSSYLWLVFHLISITALFISSVITMVDLELYRHWGFRADTTPIFYAMGAESEALGSVEISVAIKLLFILASLFTIPLFIYSRLSHKLKKLTPASRKTGLTLLIITALLFIPIRGSFTVAPMNTGFVYFHPTKPFANHAAINVVWNFMKSVTKSGRTDYPKNFYDREVSQNHFNSLFADNDSTTLVIFESPKPNVILFILESFTASVIEPLGGVKGLTPNLNKLCENGILFDQIYSSGDRTDKGVVSVLSGYPAQPITSIIKFPSKTQKLPYLNHYMKNLGYHTSFIYGGDIDFANFRSYLTQSKFDHITTHEDFPEEDESKWGVHDHIVFQKALQEIDTTATPFFKIILSLSSHEPFDVPMEPYVKGTDAESLFLNSVYYTDKSLGGFIAQAQNSDWWKNTVLILIADHGHRLPGNKALHEKERFRIPLIFTGGAVEIDSVISTYGNQTDLPNTLLAQLAKPETAFRFSKNLLSASSKSFAYYFFNNGFGYVAPGEYVVFDNTSGAFIVDDVSPDKDISLTKAYQQILYLDYNSK